MPSFRTVLDYFKAVQTAARRRPTRYPYAIYSVLVCRFRYGLGARLHSLFNLFDVAGEQWGDYLIDERMHEVLRSINRSAAREIANDKLMFQHHCFTHSLPTIPVICAIHGGNGNHPTSFVIAGTEEEWCARLNYAPSRIFVKPIDGSRGRGAFVAERREDLWYYDGNYGSAATLYAFLMQRMNGKSGWMVQPLVDAHQGFRSITSSHALSTIRANTCLVDGVPRLLFAVLRIPVGDNVTDNFAHGTTGNIVAPIDIKTGRLLKCRGSASKKWPEIVDIAVHPDTGNIIKGYQIPMWDEVLTLLERAQKSLPALRTLGWDIAITDDGPLIVETNATYDIDIVQVAYQRGVRSDIEAIFGMVQ